MLLIKLSLNSLLRYSSKYIRRFSVNKAKKKPPWNVAFFGTDEFSLFSLKALTTEYRKGELIHQLEVITSVKEKANPIQRFATKENLSLHKWPNLPENDGYDIGLVVSFGHLIPECIINKFQLGMLNVHASLLPRWRGAAPIIYAIANGDNKTGITIMRIRPKKFDVGEIISQTTVNIPSDVKMPELYKQLGSIGAECLIKSLQELPNNLERAVPQPTNGVTFAPKLTPNFACIDWEKMTSRTIYNLDRALTSVFPLKTMWNNITVKLIGVQESNSCLDGNSLNAKPGFVKYNKLSKKLNILCKDLKYIEVEKVSVLGKKVMSASEFNNGYLNKAKLECRHFK